MSAIAPPELHSKLDTLILEAKTARETAEARWADNIRLRQGDHWRLGHPRVPNWQSQLVLNFADTMLQRSVGLMTDAKPSIVIQPLRPTEADQRAADSLTKIVDALWDEYSWTQVFEEALNMAGTASMVGISLPYDPMLDNERGDIDLRVIDPRSLLFDPVVTAARKLRQGQYVITEWPMAMDEAVERYQITHPIVRDDDLSTFALKEPEPRRMLGRAGRIVSAVTLGRNQQRTVDSAVPRVWVQHFQLKDYARHPRDAGSPYIFPRPGRDASIAVPPGERLYPTGRSIIRVGKSSKIIASDDRNPYWEGLFDTELFNWNVMFDDAFGSSEMDRLRSAQLHINQIASLMADNAASMQNGIWIGDSNALTPEDWDRLTNEPGLTVKKRPGSDLKRDTGNALPQGVLQFITFLLDSMRTVAGLTGVTEGRAGTATSGVAIESLQTASQTIVRVRSRQLEAFMTRIFSRIVPRIFQFMTRDRRFWITGEAVNGFDSIDFIRQEFINTLREGDSNASMAERWRDFRFAIVPGSSLGITAMQRVVLATDLFQLGIIDDEEVFRAAKWPNWKNVQARVQQKKIDEAIMAQALQNQPPSQNGSVNVESPGGKRGVPAAAPANTIGGATGAALETR